MSKIDELDAERMATAIRRQSLLMLDNLGVRVNVASSYRRYAKFLNWRNPQKKVSSRHLNRRQRHQAIMSDIIDQAKALGYEHG